MDRRIIQQNILRHAAMALTREEYVRYAAFWEGLSDVEFSQVTTSCGKAEATDPCTLKEYVDSVITIQRERGIFTRNSALNIQPTEFLSAAENAALCAEIAKSHPSDHIRLTRESDMLLIGLWEDADRDVAEHGAVMIPADLFFAETVPLMDCVISVDETADNGVIVKYRVVIFEGFAERLRSSTENDAVKVGAVIIEYAQPRAEIIMPINVVKGVDKVLHGACGYRGMNAGLQGHVSKHIDSATACALQVACLETWYGIQIALLHPVVRDMFTHPQVLKEKGDKLRAGSRKPRPVRYVKKHIICPDSLKNAMYGSAKIINRRALVWYVIGHWRSCSENKKVFVRPYWKGALRELKSMGSPREREIAQVD